MPMIGLSDFFFRWLVSQPTFTQTHTTRVRFLFSFCLSLLISVGWLIALKCCLYAIFISIAHLPTVQFITWLRFCSRCFVLFVRCIFCYFTQFAPIEWETGFLLSTNDEYPRCLRIHSIEIVSLFDVSRRNYEFLFIFMWDNLNVESQLFFGITHIKLFDIFNFTRFTCAGLFSFAHHLNLFFSRLVRRCANRTVLLVLTFVSPLFFYLSQLFSTNFWMVAFE